MARGTVVKEVEEFPRRLKIFLVLIIILLSLSTIGFLILKENSLSSAFMRTLQTLAFMFDENSSVNERLLEIFLAIVGVFLLWWILWSVADMILDGNLAKYLKMKMYSLKIMKLKNHVVIIGGGRVGEEVAKVLSLRKIKFIIIESDSQVASSLRKKKYLVIEGDSTNESVLNQANIKSASKAVLTLPKTETNILIALTIKELNPKVSLYSRCESPNLVSKLKRAGAKIVVVPEILAGDSIAESLGV